MNVNSRARQILMHGLMMVLVGLIWGIVVPATPFPRLALVAHIQLTGSGVLFLVLAVLLLVVPNHVGPRSAWVMLLSAWLTWGMLLSQIANAWWGTNRMLSIAGAQAGASGGAPWQEQLLVVTHVVAGTGMLVAWVLLVAGFWREPDDGVE
jgi:hydroxylaminobenzene mutase